MTNEMRYGSIVHFDYFSGAGTIEDENQQEIDFQADGVIKGIHIQAKVSFVIELQTSGLMATQVKVLSSEAANPILATFPVTG